MDNKIRTAKIFINSTRNFISVGENNTIDIWNFDDRIYAYKRVYNKKINLSDIKDILFHPKNEYIYIDDGEGKVHTFDHELKPMGVLK